MFRRKVDKAVGYYCADFPISVERMNFINVYLKKTNHNTLMVSTLSDVIFYYYFLLFINVLVMTAKAKCEQFYL